MARIILCDAEDGRVAAYMVSDHEAGTTTAWCAEHFADLCASVTRAAEEALEIDELTPHPQVLDNPGDEAPAVVDVQLPDDDSPLSEDDPGWVDRAGWRQVADEVKQQEETRRKLAARPDSAATSLDVVPEPGPPRR